MVGAVGGFNPLGFAVTSALSRPKADQAGEKVATAESLGPKSAGDIFLDYMKKSPAERMAENWLKAHGLTKEKLNAMSREERDAVMRQMQADIERSLKEETEKKTKIDILV